MTDDLIPLDTFRLLVEEALVGMYLIQDERMVYANRKLAQQFGYSQDEMLLLPSILDIIDPADRDRVREAIRQRVTGEVPVVEYTVNGVRKNGTTIVMDVRSVRGMHRGRPAVLGTVLDMTARKQLEDTLQALALVDELTGMYNRRGFMTLAERQLKIARRRKQAVILLAADVDNLKTINDTHGHAVGDQALVGAATVLRHTYREADIIARLGGDEFTVFPLDAVVNSAPLLLERLHKNLAEWNARQQAPFVLSMSTGTAILDEEGLSKELHTLLAEADSQLYLQKRERRRRDGIDLPFWAGDRE
ncbi:MAG: sensor domain-containing diguanylate cyclase [Vicinamibacterales bacterium]